MTIRTDEQQELTTLVREYIYEQDKVEKLVDYLYRHEIVGLEVFAYLGFDKIDKLMFQPVSRDTFIRRAPFYFHKPSRELGDIAELSQYIYYSLEFNKPDYNNQLEDFYCVLERLYYDFGIDIVTILNYTVKQRGRVGEIQPIYNWLHYLELAKKLGIEEKTPTRFIVEYNIVREMVGLEPIIYEIQEMYVGDFIERYGNRLRMDGIFPCDHNNQPILKWIGVRIKNAKRIWVDVNDKLKGSLYVEITPRTKVWGLNVYGANEDGSDIWYDLYTGPLLMEFDYTVIKDRRVAIGMTQKRLAEAVGASDRTLQKWERGETTPDGHFLLRLMNVLDIKELSEITKIHDVE
ncbi:helix-turn-helix transcriptional regulator [Paenibacillus amylolyticus]|uniref:helix-turn-helix domain-containing protein n=1 Tax=Paenibacillus amylolyticus TaxID=1451 RepID=UPI00344D2E4A